MLLHKDLGVPQEVKEKSLMLLQKVEKIDLSKHFLEQHCNQNDKKHFIDEQKLIKIIKDLKTNPVEPFEYEVFEIYNRFTKKLHYRVEKIVVRTSYDDKRDISIAILFKKQENKLISFVKTAWVNNKDDIHITLDTTKYNVIL